MDDTTKIGPIPPAEHEQMCIDACLTQRVSDIVVCKLCWASAGLAPLRTVRHPP